MLDLFSRWVLHLEVHMRTLPEEGPQLWLAQELEGLRGVFDAGQAVHLINKESAAIRVRDLSIDENDSILFLLLAYADKNVTDPVFENLDSGELRTEPKLEGEGVAVSAHMAIDLRPVRGGVSSYRAVLEDVPGIGRSKIAPFLTFLWRQAPKIQWAAPDGTVKNCRPQFDIDGRMSDTLRNDLRDGRLSMIELVQHHVDGDGFDEEGAIVEQVRTIKLSVAQGIDEQAIDLINRVRGRARELGYPNMKVRWTHGRQKTAEFGTAREDAGDVLVFRTTEIRSDAPLSQCDGALQEDRVNELRSLILEERE